MNGPTDSLLADAPMSRAQVSAVALCILLTAIDGFDVLAISFAAPGIAAEWGIDRAALGIVLSMELIGMAIGSILIGAVADRFGRRPAILGCLVVMTGGMYLAATAGNVTVLSAYRLATGLGIGGMLASTSAMAAEFSNARRRNLSVILMAAGYPVGVIIGGSIASLLLVSFDWRAVFLLGAGLTAAFLPLVWFFLPESIEYLVTRRPADALQRINTTLRRMRHATIDALPSASAGPPSSGVTALFAPGLAHTTVILTFAYFTHIMTFYFTLKWIPKIVVDLGFAEELAGSVLVWANVGGVMGSVLLGLLAQWAPVRRLVIVTLILGAFAVTWFGRGQASLVELSFAAGIAGFFTNAAVVGLYALFAQSFPTAIRAGGTGFVIGFGRGGSAAGPIVAGFLFVSGVNLPTVALLMALGSAIAAASLVFLRVPQQQHRETTATES